MTILVAGIGNIFLGDDGFGVEVAKRLAARALPRWLRVVDFGIRGFDLAYALLDAKDEGVVLVDLVSRGHEPGTLSVIEPLPDDEPAAVETHGMGPANVLALVRALGGASPPLRIVGCEPLVVDDDMSAGLSVPVAAAVEPAITLVLEVAEALRAETAKHA